MPSQDPAVDYQSAFLSGAAADAALAALRDEVPWERHRLTMFGREIDSPRLSCWIGDPDAVYTYSRTRFAPHPWTPALLALREAVARGAGASFNSVLANRYRDGRDSMGWHADAEPELGPAPVIASLSLGAERRFVMRSRRDPAQRREWTLAHGSLLVMRGATQRDWQHALPRAMRVAGERINLTFRLILAQDALTTSAPARSAPSPRRAPDPSRRSTRPR